MTGSRWRKALCIAVLLGALAWPAAAELPRGTLLITRAETLDTRSLPLLLALPGGTYSTVGTGGAVAVVAHDADDLVILETGPDGPTVMRADEFVPPVAEAWYFPPDQSRALRSQVVPGGVREPTFDVQEVGSRTLSTLLAPAGSALVFEVPEPGLPVSVLAGATLLRWLGRRRRT